MAAPVSTPPVKLPRLRLFGHPLHPALVHFPVALWCLPVFLDGWAWATGDAFWWRLSFYGLLAGLATALPVLLTGVLDYAAIPSGHRAFATANRHMVWMLAAFAIMLADALVRMGPGAPEGWRLPAAVALSAAGLLTTVIGGWLGAELVLRHGIGTVDPEEGDG